MNSFSFKPALVLLIFMVSVSFSGCYFNKINNMERDILELKKNLSKLGKDMPAEKQQTETRLKTLEEGLKVNSLKIDELNQRTSVLGGKVEEEQIREGK